MTLEIALRYIHFISIFVIVGALVAERVLLKPEMKRREVIRLSKIDGLYGLASISLLAAGLTLWLGEYGKPAAFYTENPLFHTKLGLFVIVGILSIWPTVFFIKQRKGDADDTIVIPRRIIRIVQFELLLLAIIPLFAGLMAKGIGL